MSRIVRESLSLNLKLMRIFGYYPTETFYRLYQTYSYFLFLFLTLPTPILGIFYLFLEGNLDFVRASENAFLLSESTCFIFKFWPFITNGVKIKKCILTFEQARFEKFAYNEEHNAIMEDCKIMCHRITAIFFSSVTGGVISWAIRPMFWSERRLPVDVWLPFDPLATTQLYYCTYAYVVLGISYLAYSAGVIDPLIAGLAYQATAQIKILKHNLQYLSENEDIYLNLKTCVEHHNAILDYVREYENILSYAVFSQFLGSVLVICLSCWELLLIDIVSFSFAAMVIYVLTILVELFLLCYFGTLLYDESDTIIEAMYMGNWYDYSIKTQKALLTVMERSKIPMIVTAGKLMDLSLVTFTTILRRSYSLLAVLQNFK